MGILTSRGTWAIQSDDAVLHSSGSSSTTILQPLNQPDSGIGTGVGLAENNFGPNLEFVVLALICTTISNNDSTGFSIGLRRTNSGTDFVSIDFDPDEVGLRGKIFDIPILVNDGLRMVIYHRQSFSVTNYNYLLVGKLS